MSDLVLLQGEQVMVLCKEASHLFSYFSTPRLQSREIQFFEKRLLSFLFRPMSQALIGLELEESGWQ